MAKATTLPPEGGSFTVDASGKVLDREGGTAMPDQAADRLAEQQPASAKPDAVKSTPDEEKP